MTSERKYWGALKLILGSTPLWLCVVILAMSSFALYKVETYNLAIIERLNALEKKQSVNVSSPTKNKPQGNASFNFRSNTQENEKSPEAKLLEQANSYNKDLLITVFFSLLGTVATIAIATLGIQSFSNIMAAEKTKQQIKRDLKDFLNEKLNKLETSQQIESLARSLQWLEYRLCIISSENLEKSKSIFNHGVALQERCRAIEILRGIYDADKSERLTTQLEHDVISLKSILREFVEDVKIQLNSSESNLLREHYEKYMEAYTAQINFEANQLLILIPSQRKIEEEVGEIQQILGQLKQIPPVH